MITSPWQMVMVSSRYTTVCFQCVGRLLHSSATDLNLSITGAGADAEL